MKTSIVLTLATFLIFLSGGVGASQRTHGYLHTSYDAVWHDSRGDCVWTAYWEVDMPECEAAMPAAVVEAATPEVVPAEPGLVLDTLVQFDFDRVELKAPAQARLDRLIEDLAQQDVQRIEIDGHTCSIGTEVYNQRLSDRRAASVRRYLQDRGLGEDMIVTRGYGETRPAHSNNASETRRLNRRAETRVFAIAAE